MNLRFYRGMQALILAGLGLFLISTVVEGHVLEILNRQQVFLTLLVGLALVSLAQNVFRNRPAILEEQPERDAALERDSNPRWRIYLLVLPLLIGLLIPERPLGMAAVRARGIQRHYAPAGMEDFRSQETAQAAYQRSPAQRGLLDWLRIAGADPTGDSYAGQPADVTGFVYHDPSLPTGQFLLCRFVVTNSLADARALGILVAWHGAADLTDATWVRVRGTMDPLVQEYRLLPFITAGEIEVLPEPVEPYLYP